MVWFLLDLLLIAHLSHETVGYIAWRSRDYDEWIAWFFMVFIEVWLLRVLVWKVTFWWMGGGF